MLPTPDLPVSYAKRNYIRAENYVFKEKPIDVLIVGSSISAGLDDYLPPTWYNLSMQGDSALTGLEIVMRSDKRPRIILVETNILVRDIDEEKIKKLFSPLDYQLTQYLPSRKTENAPSRFAWIFPKTFNTWQKQLRGKEISSTTPPPKDNTVSAKTLNQLLQKQLEKFSTPFPQAQLEETVQKIKDRLTALKAQGVTICLFEMPEHPALYSTERKQQFQQLLKDSFPDQDWQWVPNADPQQFQTNDGRHLTYSSLEKYSHHLIQFTDSLSSHP